MTSTVKTAIVVGGGIGGLTAGIALQNVGITPIILERTKSHTADMSSGIGLWRNSQWCYQQLGILNELKSASALMLNPSYRRKNGDVLAAPTPHFNRRFPVLCIHRRDLHKVLRSKVETHLRMDSKVTSFSQNENSVIVHMADGSTVAADILIAADGINSIVRRTVWKCHLMDVQILPTQTQKYCGYTYYRAVCDLSPDEYRDIRDSFETWGDGMRFGYVPLTKPQAVDGKKPLLMVNQVFWFASLPTAPLGDHLSHASVDETIKLQLLERFRTWHHPIPNLISRTDHANILRTDIYKIPTLKEWKQGRVVLLGDACHATAPNLAQGAGLAIEDALQLAYCLQQYNSNQYASLNACFEDYQNLRKPRAKTVQFIADTIAEVGQIENKNLQKARDEFMRTVPSFITNNVFEAVVRYSLGWNYVPPSLWLVRLGKKSLWEVVLGDDFRKLPQPMLAFRQNPTSGSGSCSVKRGNILARIAATIGRLPSESPHVPFTGSVRVTPNHDQVWTRTFGTQVFSTTMTVGPDQEGENQSRPILYEKHGPITCAYQIKVEYETKKVWLFGIPLPSWLSPSSSWYEAPNEDGWMFHGKLEAPIVGLLMEYKGSFVVHK